MSCKDKKEELIISAENYIKTNLKDPSSYERIEAKIVDTISNKKYWQDEYVKDTSKLSYLMITSDTGSYALKCQKDYVSLDLRNISEIKVDSPHHYTMFFKYRAKNGFGALDAYSRIVEYEPSTNNFKIRE